MKIMIVDDHQEMRRLLRNTLSHLAADFREYGDGGEAVVAFAQERPDWTVMDMAMKGMDGLEATRRIKASFPDARILMLTQHDSPGVRRAAREAGASAFLSKDQLTEIEQVLTAEGGSSKSNAPPRPEKS
jgi:CheY-like chemotaxis protein